MLVGYTICYLGSIMIMRAYCVGKVHNMLPFASSIPVRSHTFVEIDHEIISTVILLPSADLFKKGCC